MLSAPCAASLQSPTGARRQWLPTCRGLAHGALLTIAEQQRSEAGARLRQQAQLLAAGEDKAAGLSAEAAKLRKLPVAAAGEPDEVGWVAGAFWKAAQNVVHWLDKTF